MAAHLFAEEVNTESDLVLILHGKARLIMVIELSGVQFGLKSYAWFQNRTSA